MGFPTSRPRTFVAGLSLESMLWMGPESDAEIQADFNRLFMSTMELTGDCLFVSGPREVHQSYDEKLSLQKRAFMRMKAQDKWELMLATMPPGAGVRLQAYGEQRSEREGIGGAYLVDAQHWPGKRAGLGGALFPCQLTHGDIVSFAHQRQALGMEHIYAQGLHVFPTVGCPFECPLSDYLRSLKESQQKHLAGNGWCLPAMSAFMVYIWANTARRRPVLLRDQVFPSTQAASQLLRLQSFPLQDDSNVLAAGSDDVCVVVDGSEKKADEERDESAKSGQTDSELLPWDGNDQETEGMACQQCLVSST